MTDYDGFRVERSGAATFFARCETSHGERWRNPAMSPRRSAARSP